jgi:hypothetical protein
MGPRARYCATKAPTIGVALVDLPGMPDKPVVIDGLSWAPVPRAVADAARGQLGGATRLRPSDWFARPQAEFLPSPAAELPDSGARPGTSWTLDVASDVASLAARGEKR